VENWRGAVAASARRAPGARQGRAQIGLGGAEEERISIAGRRGRAAHAQDGGARTRQEKFAAGAYAHAPQTQPKAEPASHPGSPAERARPRGAAAGDAQRRRDRRAGRSARCSEDASVTNDDDAAPLRRRAASAFRKEPPPDMVLAARRALPPQPEVSTARPSCAWLSHAQRACATEAVPIEAVVADVTLPMS